MICNRTQLGLAIAVISLTVAPGHSEETAAKQSWAILIGVERYEKASPLRFTVNDVRQLAETLTARGGIRRENILEITDERTDERYRPSKDHLSARLQEWLAKPGPRDTLLVYFSGHGFRDSEGRLYLAPLDCDPADPAATGIPVEWFRSQLAGCPAGFKLLVLDACHAGSEKSVEQEAVAANELGASFQELERVVTIASSRADEKSQLWDAKEQSLFSYWLNQGLKGHADRDGSNSVDIDELYEYVSRNVKHTAEVRFGRPQTPVRIVRSGIDGVPEVVSLKPQRLKGMLADIAEQLAYALEERRLGKVGVLEFTNDTRVGELLGADFGLLGKYCAEELERQLVERGTGKFSVVDRRRLQQALKEQGFAVADLGSGSRLKSLSDRVGGMPVIVLGTLQYRQGHVVGLQCQLLQTEKDEALGVVAGGTAALTENEWAMLGRSVAVRPEDRRPQFDLNGTVDQPVSVHVISRLDARSQGGHVLLDPTFPFSVQLVVNGQARPGVFRGNDCFVPARSGETYAVRVENKSGRPALMRLLVDGLNTLPQSRRADAKGLITEAWAEHVSLEEARAWVLDPQGRELNGGPPVWNIEGFATATGAGGKLRKFEIVEADKSLAARQQFTDEIGLITAAFYSPAGGTRGALGTAAGEEVDADLTERGGVKVGNLIGVVHIRYVDADALGSAGN